MAEEKKPDTSEPEPINIKVVTQAGNEIYFKCKMTTPLQKLMAAFCQKQGVAQNTVRFLFDGERIAPTATPKDLDMEDGDVIDVMVEQVGGIIGGHQPEHLVSAHSHAATQAATQAATRAA